MSSLPLRSGRGILAVTCGQLFITVCLVGLIIVTSACNNLSSLSSTGGKTGSSTSSGQTNTVRVTLNPSSTTVASGGTLQFTAAVENTPVTGVIWSASTGTINSSGLLYAPKVSDTQPLVVRATSVANSSSYADV